MVLCSVSLLCDHLKWFTVLMRGFVFVKAYNLKFWFGKEVFIVYTLLIKTQEAIWGKFIRRWSAKSVEVVLVFSEGFIYALIIFVRTTCVLYGICHKHTYTVSTCYIVHVNTKGLFLIAYKTDLIDQQVVRDYS